MANYASQDEDDSIYEAPPARRITAAQRTQLLPEFLLNTVSGSYVNSREGAHCRSPQKLRLSPLLIPQLGYSC